MSDNAPALRPPPECAHLRWHWIKQASGELIVMAWTISNKWADHVGFLSPEAAWGQLWRYHGPCTPTAIVPDSAAGGTRKDSLRVEPNADLAAANAEIKRLKAANASLFEEVADLEPYVAANADLLNENERLRSVAANTRVPDSADEAMVDRCAKAIWEINHPNPPRWASWGDYSGWGPSIPERKWTLDQARAVLDALRTMGGKDG